MDLTDEKTISKNTLASFTSAITIDPKYIDAYYGRGVCYQLLGDKKDAMLDFQYCLTLDPQYQPASVALLELSRKK